MIDLYKETLFSDAVTLRIDRLGPSDLIGRVYLSTATGGRPLDVVRCYGRTYLAFRAQDGRLYVDDRPAATVALAAKALKTGRTVRGRGYYCDDRARPLIAS